MRILLTVLVVVVTRLNSSVEDSPFNLTEFISNRDLKPRTWIRHNMHVPLLDLKAQLSPLRDNILSAITEVLDSTRYIMGPKVVEFERNIARYSGVKYGIGVSSGTDALLISLMALGGGQGDLVLTTPYTFFATMGAILRLGAQPVFVDIDPVSYNIDPEKMAEVLDDYAEKGLQFKAMIPVHLYGQCSDMSSICTLAKKYDIPIIEDAAQAIGACYPMGESDPQWKPAGSLGDMGCFSFFPSKNLGGIGDGGMVVTNNSELAERMEQLRMHGMSPKYHHSMVGGNFRMDPIQAVALDVKLPHLGDWHKARRKNAANYNQLFMESGLVDDGRIGLPEAVYKDLADNTQDEPDYHIYNQYIIRLNNRDGVKKCLDEAGVGNEIYYPIPLHKQECVADLGFGSLSFPEAELASLETLALPIYPELTIDMQRYVVNQIKGFFS